MSTEKLLSNHDDHPNYAATSHLQNDPNEIRRDVLRTSLADKDLCLPTYDQFIETGGFLPPPVHSVEASAPPDIISSSVNFTFEEVKDALIEYTSQKCCYGTKAAKHADIKNVSPSTAFHYILETFTEKRSTDWSYEPFNGGMVDGPENGYPPMPWDIMVPYPGDFKNSVKVIEVPHTAKIKSCNRCFGRGETKCHNCNFGRVNCISCNYGRVSSQNSDGQQVMVACNMCSGVGTRSCISCSGNGYQRCTVCRGSGRLRFFVELKVSWTNHKDSFIEGSSDLPEKLIKEVQGDVLLVDENFRISPVNCFPVVAINTAAADIMNRHMMKITNERLIKQRQTILAVPCSEVNYEWKGKTYRFFVYGNERKVFTFEYPQSCCWCCTLL